MTEIFTSSNESTEKSPPPINPVVSTLAQSLLNHSNKTLDSIIQPRTKAEDKITTVEDLWKFEDIFHRKYKDNATTDLREEINGQYIVYINKNLKEIINAIGKPQSFSHMLESIRTVYKTLEQEINADKEANVDKETNVDKTFQRIIIKYLLQYIQRDQPR
jgi:hypothetical protein